MAVQSSPASILVVEDEGDLRTLIGYNLSRRGYAVELTSDLCSARESLKTGRPDLVILDLMLPDGSGLDLARQIRLNSSLAGVPILFVTARPKETDLRECCFSPQDDYLLKPFSIRELLRRVQAQVQSQTGEGARKELIS